jgi:phenylpyruvate tautomerase PptA (4-oxalocrotonate tautomerase family)
MIVSCKPAQKIVYGTDTFKTLEIGKNVNFSFSVQTFEDIRSESKINETHFIAKQWNAKINGKQSCINSEVLYKVPVAEQMTAIFAQHLTKKLPQISVVINQKEDADYYLEATIKHFYGIQEFSTAAAVGAQFGLIGALATANVKTDGKIVIELTDIKVFDKQNNLITSMSNLRKEYEGEFPADANCFCIYRNVNQKLSEFNDELIGLLLVKIRNKE